MKIEQTNNICQISEKRLSNIRHVCFRSIVINDSSSVSKWVIISPREFQRLHRSIFGWKWPWWQKQLNDRIWVISAIFHEIWNHFLLWPFLTDFNNRFWTNINLEWCKKIEHKWRKVRIIYLLVAPLKKSVKSREKSEVILNGKKRNFGKWLVNDIG